MDSKESVNKLNGLEIAIIGIAAKFPEAENIQEYWNNLKNGKESVCFFSDEELEQAGIDRELLNNANYVKAKAKLDRIDEFDAQFFNYTPVEAEVLDPQKRFFMECAWKALEDSGYNPDSGEKKIGLYAGASLNSLWIGMSYNTKNATNLGSFALEQLANKEFMPLTVSYKLNLKGPSVLVQTACSTSLVAVDMACKALLTGQCEMAMAGGVSINIPNKTGYLYQDGMINSPDGHCRAFDSKAKGTISGEGVGIIVLKLLEDAIKEKDHIYAIIKGSAVNNDGKRKVGYTAPSVQGQADVIKMALSISEVGIENISYIETHGTGTILGDPIEIEALRQVFNISKEKKCGIGSVKTNIGHLDAAAGIAGLIKVVLALKNKLIPPSLNYEEPNPKIDFENSPFYVNTTLKEWKSDNNPLTAGVSSFGIGGTNAHVILQEAPEIIKERIQFNRPELLLFSAKTKTALERVKKDFISFFKNEKEVDLSDVAYTLQTGRKDFQYREMLVCDNFNDAIKKLSIDTSYQSKENLLVDEKKQVVFMFPGQGSQYVNMGFELYKSEKVFREELDSCFVIAKKTTGYNLRNYLFPELDEENRELFQEEKGEELLKQTWITQPVLFIFEYALSKLLMSWGVIPFAMIGHSLGEYVAATLSGVFSIEDALKLVSLRGKLMAQVEPGVMISVLKPASEVIRLLENSEASLAAVNSPSSCVIAGTKTSIELFEGELSKLDISSVRLNTSHAFHSCTMDLILEEYKCEVKKITINTPQIPFISNVSGKWISNEEVIDPLYWSSQIRNTVYFSSGIEEIFKHENLLFIEVGPGETLSNFVKQHIDNQNKYNLVNLVRHPNEKVSDIYYMVSAIGDLWLYGKKIDFRSYHSSQKRSKISLPTYSFDRQSYWPEYTFSYGSQVPSTINRSNSKDVNINDWLYLPNWKRSLYPVLIDEKDTFFWIVFANDSEFSSDVIVKLKKEKDKIIIVRLGDAFVKVNDNEYIIDCKSLNDYNRLFASLKESSKSIVKIIHLWSIVDKQAIVDFCPDTNNVIQEIGYFSLLNIVKAIVNEKIDNKLELIVASNNTIEVTGSDLINPICATILGPVRVIPQEFENISCRLIDVDKKALDRFIQELFASNINKNIAFRNGIRWEEDFMQSNIQISLDAIPKLKKHGVYLILGGVGGIGLALAYYLAKNVQAKIILLSRTQLPDKNTWKECTVKNDINNYTKTIIEKIIQLEALGSEVFLEYADVSDFDQMSSIIDKIKLKIGDINGVIHCAGISDGGLITTRTEEDSKKVFASKLQGTLIVDRLLKNERLDFVVFSSSLNSILGAAGQVGYCAVSAFLDAFVQYKRNCNKTKYYCINWDSWKDVGMAAEFLNKENINRTIENEKGKDLDHPFFTNYVIDNNLHIFNCSFNVEDYWVLKEHKIFGLHTLPGTALLELMRAAYECITGKMEMELIDIYFYKPFIVQNAEKKDIQITLMNNNEVYECFIKYLPKNKYEQEDIIAKGLVKNLSKENIVLSEIDVKNYEIFNNNSIQFDKTRLGPRWDNFVQIKVGENEGIAELELSNEYIHDFEYFKLHPALLDVAVAVTGYQGDYLPLSYKSVKVRNPLTKRILIYYKHDINNNLLDETLQSDIVVFAENGQVLVEIEKYCVKKVSQSTQKKIENLNAVENTIDKEMNSFTGVQIFDAVLKNDYSQVLVSVDNLFDLVETRKKLKLIDVVRNMSDNTILNLHSRPKLEQEYVEPSNIKEKTLVNIFKGYLGYNKIGIKDTFFDLGGDSLKAMQITQIIKKEFNIEISLNDLFNNPDILSLSEFINKTQEEKDKKEFKNEILI